MPERRTTIELHRLYETEDFVARDMVVHFQSLQNNAYTHPCGNNAFELVELQSHPGRIEGVIRKFQDENLPHYGRRGGTEQPLNIPSNAGLINRVYFAFYERNGLLALHRNSNFCTVGRFNSLMSELVGHTVVFNPVLYQEQINRLMSYREQIKKVTFGFAGNPNAQEEDPHDFSERAMSWVGGMNGYYGDFSLRGNGYSRDPNQRYLDRDIAESLRRFVSRGEVSKAKIWVEDLTHPIDLFADKVIYVADVTFRDRYPEPHSIKRALRNAATLYFDGDLG